MKIVFFYYDYQEKIGKKNRVEFPPLGLLSICSVAEKIDCDVEVVTLTKETKINKIPRADVYGYAITSSVNYPFFLEIVPKLKSRAKLHIAGSTQANIFPELVLNDLSLDAVFQGESENSFYKWILDGCKKKGIISGSRVDVNSIPMLARHLLLENKIYLNQRVGGEYDNVISMISSRGCPFYCTYCAAQNKGKVYFRSLENFQEELEHVISVYDKCRGVTLMDETFTLCQDHAVGIAEAFKKYGLIWECNSRADTINVEMAKKFLECNCREVKIGLETGSQFLLNKMKKGINLIKSKAIIKIIGSLGLPIKLYIMHGFPGENMSTTKETIKCLSELRPFLHRIAVYRFSPLPGSAIYSDFKQRGFRWSQFTIYKNNTNWWCNKDEYKELESSYELLTNSVCEMFRR